MMQEASCPPRSRRAVVLGLTILGAAVLMTASTAAEEPIAAPTTDKPIAASTADQPTAAPTGDKPIAPVAASTGEAAAGSASPVAVLAGFEEAWRAGDVDRVLASISGEAVELTLEKCGGPPRGRFARTQAQFLIRDLLHYGETDDFRIVAFDWKEETAPRARAQWVHRMASGEKRAELEIELAREAGAWRVTRIAAR